MKFYLEVWHYLHKDLYSEYKNDTLKIIIRMLYDIIKIKLFIMICYVAGEQRTQLLSA